MITSATSPRVRFWAAWTAAILLAGALGFYFRLYPLTVFPRDLARNTAKFKVQAKLRAAAIEAIAKQSDATSLSPAARDQRMQLLVNQTIHKDPKQFDRLVNQHAKIIEKQTRILSKGGFLLEVDPYYYLHQTRLILQSGRFADQTRGREYLNLLTLAPAGYWYPMDLHPYVGAWLYRAVSVIRPKIDLVAVLRWVPVLISFFALGLFAWFSRNVAGITGWAGLLGLVNLMLCHIFLKRSLVGWYDTDPYNVLFPLAAIAGIFMAFGDTVSARKRWTGALLTGTAFGLHALFWRGWMTPFLVIFLFSAASLLLPRRLKPANLSRRLQILLMIPMALLPLLFILVVWGPLGVLQEFTSTADFIRGFLRPEFRPWPDVFITVGELKPLEFGVLTKLLGGPVWVLAVALGIMIRLVRQCIGRGSESKQQTIPLLLLFALICTGLVVSVKIQRFAILVAAPLAVAVPYAWMEWRRIVSDALPLIFAPKVAGELAKRMGIFWGSATLAMVVFLGFQAHEGIRRFYPIYNPAWDQMMKKVRETTPQNAIITGWWSPGHFLTSMGERRVTFDGSSQNEPQAYWVANLFIQDSEEMALGILRMLNTSGNTAADYLTDHGFALADAVELIQSVLPLSRAEAKDRLQRRFSSEESDRLLDLTHGTGQLPPSYLFTYNHMFEQALALEFIGRWNFRRAEAFQQRVKQQPNEVDSRALSRATPQNRDLLWSMSEQPTFYEKEGYEIGRKNNRVSFTNGVSLDPKTMDAEIRGNANVNGRPTSVIWVNERDQLIETAVANPTLNVSILWMPEDPENGYPMQRSVILGNRIAKSVGMRLYYLGGRGLKYLRKTVSEDSATYRTRLSLFEVDWKGLNGKASAKSSTSAQAS